MAVIATIDPSISHELSFDLNISGTKDEPSDIRFINESQIDPATGDSVQDVFSIICRAVRSADGVKITIPRLLNLFRSGSYKSRLEVVLENRQFVPLSEEIMITENVKPKEEPIVQEPPVVEESKPIAKPFVEKSKPVDKTWRAKGFEGIRNPFKGGVAPSP